MKNIQEQKLKFRKKQLIFKQRNKMTAKIKPNLYNLEKIFTMPQFSKTLLRKFENHVIQQRQCFFKFFQEKFEELFELQSYIFLKLSKSQITKLQELESLKI